MDLTTTILFILGLFLLIGGAELLVRGSSRLAAAVGISPLVIGLTVVAFGTSSPELAVTVQAAVAGQADIAVGNVVGSNIFNVLFILGVSALITPLVVSQQLIRLDVPLMIGASLTMIVMSFDRTLSRMEGVILFAGLVAYTVWSIRQSRREQAAVKLEYEREYGKPPERSAKAILLQILMAIAGLTLLVLGSRWFVEGAISIARFMGVSELIIGLTIIAAGTSLPEVATSIIASIRGERDIAVGNVVGSNIFNIFGVLGSAAILAPSDIAVSSAVLSFDLPVMLAVAVACLPIFFHENRIDRWEGGVFFGYYIAYTAYLILDSTGHDYLPYYSAVMLWFVMPLTTVTIVVVLLRYARREGSVNTNLVKLTAPERAHDG
ncbi:MAG TPA: calcium/sodium antiporter [Bacteroidota bacterium]|nr:calcium/sodium antiporter [Bacteroidota bacterium]